MDPSIPPLVASGVAIVVAIITMVNARAQIRSSRESALEQIRATAETEKVRIRSEAAIAYYQKWADQLREELSSVATLCDPDSDSEWIGKENERKSTIARHMHTIDLLLAGEDDEVELARAVGHLATSISLGDVSTNVSERLSYATQTIAWGQKVISSRLRSVIGGHESQLTTEAPKN
ncbi:MAG: hypothetical protein MI807_06750 [Verrucomicrobiales bacterium]|nr:hypothetical protein [Verrucomicrobiales bacterium]